MNRTFFFVASREARAIACSTLVAGLALLVPACDCAGNTTNPGVDAGDTGPASDGGDGGGRDGGRDASVDANVDVGPTPDANVDGCVSSAETCNGIDDDCDGTIDDGVTQSCGMNVGVCRTGTQTCSAGTFGTCMGAIDPGTEICGNGLDDDCDEMVDDGCTCTDGATQSCGSGVGECRRGTQTCASSAWGACVGEVTPVAEACDGTRDDDCDGTVDEGCGCTSGATQACGSSVGACSPGTQTCVAGAWGPCTGGVQPTMETCNGADDNCDGSADEGNPMGGAACGSSTGVCTPGVETCTAGSLMCIGGVMPGTETCNGMDDNCDGTTDEGFNLGAACDGPDTDSCTEGTNMCNATGGSSCSDATGDSVETCNGMDDDCDGNVDEGNPGGGVLCAGATDVGACVSRTACVAGSLICRGTFVAPPGAGGSPTNPGTPALPLSTVALAQGNATAIGGGADVCLCDPAGGAPSTFSENVVMIEGTSVLGNYDCATWTRTGGASTVIADVDGDGLNFPSGITSATSLEQLTVNGTSGPNPSQAVTINGSAPLILNVTVVGGQTPSSTAIECTGCGAQMRAVTANGGSATTRAIGFHGTGALTGLSVSTSSFSGGTTSMAGSASFGVRLEGCTSASTWTSTSTFGGSSPPGGAPVGTRTGFDASGATCAPSVTGGSHVGCEASGVTCIGVSCSAGAPCSVTGSLATSPSGGGIRGATSHVSSCIGVQCTTGGCASFVNNSISAGFLLGASTVGMGMQIDGASPIVDRNTITGPQGGIATPPMVGRFYGLYLHTTASLVTNNIILDGSWVGAVDVLRFDLGAASGAVRGPTVHSNTIQFTSCTACGARVGLGLAGVAGAIPQGVFRNNVFDHSGAGGLTRAVVEYDVNADPMNFENNDMNDTVLYFDEGSTPLTLAMVNALGAGYSGNIAGSCGLTATQHLPGTGSICYDAGTAVAAATNHDFDNESRPFSVAGSPRYDIGADELHP